jgi:predicted small lipoprotein YifL
MRFLAALVLPLLLLILVAACGQKGPLYLRENPPPGVKPPKPKPYEPVPYPPDTQREEEKK